MGYLDAIRDQTARALWEAENVLSCIPGALWEKEYCGIPLYKHVYHMLHSLDRWLINPERYEEPAFHTENLNNLDVPTAQALSRAEMEAYFAQVREKITAYLDALSEDELTQTPEGSAWTRFTLILAQHRHLHTHMGMLMGFIIAETGLWPRVLGLTGTPRERSGPEYM